MTEGLRFPSIAMKTVIVHTVTYFMMGFLFSTVFDYGTAYAETALNLLMRPVSHPLVMAGVLFQPLRGLLFGVAFYLMRREFFVRRRGWLTMWAILVIVGILSTFGPAPGSVEGLVYTSLPIESHFIGQIEVWTQSFLLALLTNYWVTHPGNKWLSISAWSLFAIVLILPVMGLVFGSAG